MKLIFFILLNIYYSKNNITFDEKEIKNICSRCHSNFNEEYNDTELIEITKDETTSMISSSRITKYINLELKRDKIN